MVTLAMAKRRAPLCLVGCHYYDMAQSIGDCRFAAQFEIDLAEEGESERLPPRSIATLRKYIEWIDSANQAEGKHP